MMHACLAVSGRVSDAARTIILGALMQIDAKCLSNVNRDIVKRNQSVHALPVVLDKVLHHGLTFVCTCCADWLADSCTTDVPVTYMQS